MSRFIKFFNKIEHLLTQEQQADLENYAYQYAKFWRVYFKILKVQEQTIVIKVEQEKKPTKTDYFSIKELNDRTKELFSKYFEGYTIYTNPTPYQESPPEVVDLEWIHKQMNKYHIGAKVLVKELGLSKSEISLYLSGKNPLGGRSRAMFYYYFLTYKLNNSLKE